jgi:hypothetical protein
MTSAAERRTGRRVRIVDRGGHRLPEILDAHGSGMVLFGLNRQKEPST